ncbi:MAG: 4-hydroxy-3-methylbut-2-enyl diphosphate reductase [Patescibacteria group bacterium]|nr:4-hydroxy-3-methylbut-2-enyl diphosphate reductase [Patescibacteria group bacterium]
MVAGLDMAAARQPVFILGSLVHNDAVNERIEKKGISRIDRETFFAASAGEIGTIIITAHGSGPDVYAAAKEKNIDIIDTTCPKVLKVQRLARAYKKRGYAIILVGDRDHKETRGIDEWGGGGAAIISNDDDLKNIHLDRSGKIAVLAQTTQNEDFFRRVGEYLKKKYSDVKVLPTTCGATHERQEEVKRLANEFETVLVIGSPESANSNRLYEIAKEINAKTYFIENADQLEDVWFKGVKSAAVTAGASTPEWVIEDVINHLRLI